MRTCCTSVSVIICAYTLDRWSDFVAAVESVQAQSLVPTQFIVVIDHNDELLSRALATSPSITVVASKEPAGLSGARNTGLALSAGEIVAFLDDDAVACETWLAELARGYSDENVLGVGGFIAPLWESKRPGWFPEEFDWVLGCTYRGMPEGTAVRNLIGANMSFRRDVLTEVGGFSHELGRKRTGGLGDEETGACIRAAQRFPGGIFVYASRAHVDHRVPSSRTTWHYFRERCFGEGVSKAQLSRAVGSRDGLASERRHALVTLPVGVGHAIGAFFTGDSAGLARACALVAGLIVTTFGYVVGRLNPPQMLADTKAQAASLEDAEPESGDRVKASTRLRLLMVTPRYTPLVGGVENHVAQVARLMVESADVTVLTTDTTGALPKSEIIDGVTVVRVRAWPRKRDYYFAPGIYRAIRRGEWDLVHVQSYHTAVAPIAMLAALRARIPYVLTFHGGGHSSATRNALRGLQWQVLRPLLARARRLIAVAEFEAERFSAALKIPRERFVVIPNGSDLSSLLVQAERRETGERPVIASVGRLERYKGHQRVIEAMPWVLRELPGSSLRVIGTGPYKPELESLVEKLGLGGKVTIGAIPGTDRQAMAQTLVWCSLVVLMSDFETHPLAVIEALQLGRPALVADTSGLRELAQLGVARAVPLDQTPEELAAQMLDALNNPLATAPDMSAPTWPECAARLLSLYSEVLAHDSTGAYAGVSARAQG